MKHRTLASLYRELSALGVCEALWAGLTCAALALTLVALMAMFAPALERPGDVNPQKSEGP